MTAIPARAMQIESKTWGSAKTIYRDARSEIVEITVKKGGYCSRHFHRKKDNLFLVVEGVLLVIICPETISERKVCLTAGGKPLLIPAGTMHQFEAQTDVVAWEHYRAAPGGTIDQFDIARTSEGGIRA